MGALVVVAWAAAGTVEVAMVEEVMAAACPVEAERALVAEGKVDMEEELVEAREKVVATLAVVGTPATAAQTAEAEASEACPVVPVEARMGRVVMAAAAMVAEARAAQGGSVVVAPEVAAMVGACAATVTLTGLGHSWCVFLAQ